MLGHIEDQFKTLVEKVSLAQELFMASHWRRTHGHPGRCVGYIISARKHILLGSDVWSEYIRINFYDWFLVISLGSDDVSAPLSNIRSELEGFPEDQSQGSNASKGSIG